ncbi:MAG: T9SS type A sorting domain-containing protein [Bacteroidales bacterium]|jgi:hypothetical protein|nr:T9SS type A sorting domain-containing protein [Bacteroidales bacterium]
MKKTILFIAVIAFGLSIKAQSFLVTRGDDGTSITDSVVYELDAHEDIRWDYIHLQNITDTAITLRMQIHRLQMAENASIGMCFGDQCLFDTIAQDVNLVTIQPQVEYTGFDLQYNYTNLNRSIIKVNLLNANDNAIIQSFLVYYEGLTSGLQAIEASNKASIGIYPNPANNIVCIKYTLPKNCSTPSLIVKNMLGKEVKNVKINNNQSGKVYLNTEDLTQGIYFCSIVCEEQAIVTKKMIVKH